MARGTLILVVGPMGSGKSMLMNHAKARFPELVTPFSYTTRARRPESVENDHYKFLTVEEFKERISNDEFLEWAEFSGNFYGTLKCEVDEGLAAGKVMFKEMEVQGVRQVLSHMPEDEVVTIFIDAGPWEELVRRALARAPMGDEELEKRRLHHENELTFMPAADVIIYNREGEKEEAKRAFEAVIEVEIKKVTT